MGGDGIMVCAAKSRFSVSFKVVWLITGVFLLLSSLGCSNRYKGIETKGAQVSDVAKVSMKNAKAQNVWRMFRQVSRIPRCSKHEQQICGWLRDFAEEHKLLWRSDSVGNTVIELPATAGYENSPTVVLQSHVDMVCEKTPESKHDFCIDPIELFEKDGWVYADGTTLGADDGIGMSLALAFALEKEIAHPKIELLFTVDEETGLTGANALQKGFITGKYLINLDGEGESLIVGCAGGENTEITLKFDWIETPAGYECYTLKVSGLLGGHSGIDIDKQRANAIQLLTRTLRELQGRFDARICSIDGGKANNAIPRDATAVVCLDSSRLDAIRGAIVDMESLFKAEFAAADPGLKVEVVQSGGCGDKVLSTRCAKTVIDLLSAIPAGVYRMSNEFKGKVETSNNLARVETVRDENLLRITTMQRGFEESSMDDLTSKISAVGNLAGVEVKISGRYPGWKPDMNSNLLRQCGRVYTKLFGKAPQTKIVHAGLETAVIGKNFPDIEMVCIGPEIKNAHSPQERVNIGSVDNAWRFLLELIPALR